MGLGLGLGLGLGSGSGLGLGLGLANSNPNPNPTPKPNPNPNPNATSLAQDEATLHERGGTLRSVELAALRLVLFEKQLLAAALRELHDVPAAA